MKQSPGRKAVGSIGFGMLLIQHLVWGLVLSCHFPRNIKRTGYSVLIMSLYHRTLTVFPIRLTSARLLEKIGRH